MTEAAKTEQELAVEAAEAKAVAENATRTGVGTRVRVGQTRGRNPLVISFENFDESQPSTLPKTITEFMNVTKIEDEPTLMAHLIDGFNEAQYKAASDPVSEFVESYWDDDLKARFKVSIRNFSRDSGLSIEDAVSILKPAIVKANPAK